MSSSDAAAAPAGGGAGDGGEEIVTRELLSSHSTRARFVGVRAVPCRHRTSLCPDRCGHGGDVAEFAVIEYLDHTKPGEYGDARQAAFHVRPADAAPHVAAALRAMAPGTHVRLDWVHDYVTRTHAGGGVSKSPERHITLLEVDDGAPAPAAV